VTARLHKVVASTLRTVKLRRSDPGSAKMCNRSPPVESSPSPMMSTLISPTSPVLGPSTTTTRVTTTTTAVSVSYANCDAVRAAGKAPLDRGEPGYSSKLDRDGDGIACE
jgi:Excalibur calcium-binding domain